MTENEQIEEMAYQRLSVRVTPGVHPVILHIDCEKKCNPIFKRCEWCDLEKELLNRLADLEDMIENGTLVDTKGYRKVERGEWKLIGNGNGRPIHWKCSVCGYETLDAANGDTNFCPNCGADMRGEDDGKIH